MTGKTISHYRIFEKLGEGGMGVVYKAEDENLRRPVALKFLRAVAIGDRQLHGRFWKEAEAAAALDHPSITTIYEIAEFDAQTFIAMALVDGESLAAKIKQRPLPLSEAMRVGSEVAEALEAAHRRGIVHRDIKPSNIMITTERRVKVMDFGLAHLSGQTRITKTGTIMGTPAYMSPEQAQGEKVDHRSDIWSLGVVLYEMVTGTLPFKGDSDQAMLFGIISDKQEPMTAIRVGTPPELDRIVGKALAKQPPERYQHADDLMVDLRSLRRATNFESETTIEHLATPTGGGAPMEASAVVTQSPKRNALPWIALTGVLVVALTVALAALWQATRPVGQPLIQFDVKLGPDIALSRELGANAILSPDGTRLVFVSQGPNKKTMLYTRLLSQPQAIALPGTEDASTPFFSPDGEWVVFFADNKLQKISSQGGEAVTLCDAAGSYGGSWGEDGNIIAALSNRGGLSRVSAAGGAPEPVTELDEEKEENSHRWPQVLPGGRAILFTAGLAPNWDEGNIEALLLETGERKTLARGGSYGRYLPSGHLLYVHEGTLFAAPMSLDRLELTGPPAPVLEEVSSTIIGDAQFNFSQTGMVVYLKAQAASREGSIHWLDSTGQTRPLLAKPGIYTYLRFSPDGNRLAVAEKKGANSDLWVYEWKRDTMSRLTVDPALDNAPVWSPDGQYIAF